MEVSDWRFLLDENVSRSVEEQLDGRGHDVEHVVDGLEPGVDDLSEVLPYARQEDRVIVTKDYSDFGALEPRMHQGVILIADHGYQPHAVADAVERVVTAYGSREAFGAGIEFLDDWM